MPKIEPLHHLYSQLPDRFKLLLRLHSLQTDLSANIVAELRERGDE